MFKIEKKTAYFISPRKKLIDKVNQIVGINPADRSPSVFTISLIRGS